MTRQTYINSVLPIGGPARRKTEPVVTSQERRRRFNRYTHSRLLCVHQSQITSEALNSPAAWFLTGALFSGTLWFGNAACARPLGSRGHQLFSECNATVQGIVRGSRQSHAPVSLLNAAPLTCSCGPARSAQTHTCPCHSFRCSKRSCRRPSSRAVCSGCASRASRAARPFRLA